MFSPSVPSFSIKFCWERLWTTGIFPQQCSWALPDPSPSLSLCLSLYSSYTASTLSLMRTHNTHVDSLLLYLWLAPLHHQSCRCCQSICRNHHLHVTNGCTRAFAVRGVTHECHPFCKVNHLNFGDCISTVLKSPELSALRIKKVKDQSLLLNRHSEKLATSRLLTSS